MMDIVGLVAGLVLSIPLGFVGGFAYQQYRYWKIKRYAPSAEIVSFHVALREEEYDNLPKKEDDVVYYFKNKNGSSGGPAAG